METIFKLQKLWSSKSKFSHFGDEWGYKTVNPFGATNFPPKFLFTILSCKKGQFPGSFYLLCFLHPFCTELNLSLFAKLKFEFKNIRNMLSCTFSWVKNYVFLVKKDILTDFFLTSLHFHCQMFSWADCFGNKLGLGWAELSPGPSVRIVQWVLTLTDQGCLGWLYTFQLTRNTRNW